MRVNFTCTVPESALYMHFLYTNTYCTGEGANIDIVPPTDQVEDSGGVASEAGHLSEGGVAPQDDLVLGVAVCANYFVSAARPSQVTHLGKQGEREREREAEREGDTLLQKHDADSSVL